MLNSASTLLHEVAIMLTRKNRTVMCFLFITWQIVFVLEMVADADADKVGLDVVGGEGECGEKVVVEVIA